MADIFGRIIAVNQQVYLNTGRLWGINTINISPEFGNQGLSYIGIENKPINQIVNTEQYADITINGNFINSDYFIQYTGTDCFNMFILQNQGSLNNSYSLISGYLNSYNLKFGIGQPIEISAGIRFVKDVGQIYTGILDPTGYQQLISIPNNIYENTQAIYNIPTFHSTQLTLNELTTQRVIDASINFKINRLPIYNIGNNTPSKINIIYPIKVTCSFIFEINIGYSGIELKSLVSNQQVQNITFSLYDYLQSGNLLATYNLTNMTCVKEDYSISVDGNVKVDKSFVGYIFN